MFDLMFSPSLQCLAYMYFLLCKDRIGDTHTYSVRTYAQYGISLLSKHILQENKILEAEVRNLI